MGKKTDKLVSNVEDELYLTKRAFFEFTEEIRIAWKGKEFDTGLSMGALRKKYGEEGAEFAAKLMRIIKEEMPKLDKAVKKTKAELSILSAYVGKKRSKLPWSSKSVKKAKSFISSTTKFLNDIPDKVKKLIGEMEKTAELNKLVASGIARLNAEAAEMKKLTRDESED
ncbi:MAG: hypothetical protein WBS20_05425 [Lysobacterales bacterium]